MASSPISRGILGSLIDKAFAWSKGLRPETCTYTITRVKIPLDESVSVPADLFLPVLDTTTTTDGKPTKALGTLLVRSPYGISFPTNLGLARVYAARGYQVLISACRDTHTDQEGGTRDFEPASNEFADGHATVHWMRQQSWYSGSFATLGGSYLGYVQWALLAADPPPPDMRAAVIMTGPADFVDFAWGCGALSSNVIARADIQPRIKSDGLVSIMLALRSLSKRLKPVFDSVPLMDGVDRHFGGKMPDWLRLMLDKPDREDERIKSKQQNAALEKAEIPILLVTGWDDLLIVDVMKPYDILRRRGVDVALTVGPWTHLGLQADSRVAVESMQWLDTTLAHLPSAEARKAPVHAFVGRSGSSSSSSSSGEWRDLPSWPPSTIEHAMYLSTDGRLIDEPPEQSSESLVTFTFRPSDPTPSVSHPLLFDNGPGRAESSDSLLSRSDMLVFETSPLDKALVVCGKPRLRLHHSSSSPHADLYVLLCEVDGAGKAHSISEVYTRLDPGRSRGDGDGVIELSLHDCGRRFGQGSRIRLFVAGGSHPRFIRNLGSGEDSVSGSRMEDVEHSVHLGSESRLILPVTETA